MVCIPCIVIPFVLWVFHKFIQPYIAKVWNPWKKVEGSHDGGGDSSQPLKCPMKTKESSSEKVLPNSKDSNDNGDVSSGMTNGHADVTSGGDKKRD